MAMLKLNADERTEAGSKASRALRATGFIPANLYSRGESPTALKLNSVIWEKALTEDQHLIMLDIPGTKPQVATVREIQRDPISQDIIHIDLIKVQMDEAIKFMVRVETVGIPAGVREGGVTQILMDHIEVECLPTDVPDVLKLDVSMLNIGESHHVRDLVVGEGVKIANDPDTTLFSVTTVRATEAVVAAPTEETPEGEAEKALDGK
jgi:large subunit ribosomal protein L25